MWSTGDEMITMAAEHDQRRSAPTLGPAHRPPAALRVFIGLLAVGAALFNVALMLSDRAPGLMQRIFGDFAVRLSDRLDRSERIGALTEGRNPGNDAIVHIGVWGVAMVLVGLAIWRWAPLIIGGALLFVASVFVEIGQGRYSDTRAVEMSDVVANGAGVTLGVAVCAVVYIVWSGVAATLGRLRGR